MDVVSSNQTSKSFEIGDCKGLARLGDQSEKLKKRPCD